MGIDYRKEVDSGFDRKRIVESNVVALLREGIPIDIITKSPEFNFKHHEMVNNLEYGHISKETQILEIYGGYEKDLSEQIVPAAYSGVSHPVGGELYPMENNEEIEKFKERDNYISEIDKLTALEIKNLGKDKNKLILAITKYKAKFPIIDRILEALDELDNLKTEKGEYFDAVLYASVFIKHGLDSKKITTYDNIYKGYKELVDKLSKVTIEYEDALSGKIHNKEISRLIRKKNILETEIIQRNTKLVNGFIRQKYSDLLVETDELFQTCYIAMWKAAKEFDYKKGYKFSTMAYSYMDAEIKHCFKQLTGYNWEDYWLRKKVNILIKNTSELLERNVSVAELVQYGFLDVSEKKVRSCLGLAEEYSFSALYPTNGEKYDEYLTDNLYNTYFGDDEIDDYGTEIRDIETVNYEDGLFSDELKQAISNALSALTEREQIVITLRYGLDGNGPRGLEEVGNVIGVTRERVRQIEGKALRKLRHPSRGKLLEPFFRYNEEDNDNKISNIRR